MRYNIHLWQLDETGHWTAYAVGCKHDGSVTNERDTEATNPPLALIDAQLGFGIPTPDTARWAISVFNGIVRGHLPTAETRKTVNESGGINIDAALSLLNPTPPIQGGDTFAEGMGGCFISKLLSYPRFITPKGKIEIGGVDYLDLWQDNKPLPHVRFTTPEEILAEERRKRGGFDETVAAFCETVKWIGESTRTSKAARCVIGKVNALVRAFTSLGFADILRIDELANEAAEALQAMCEELADRKDAQATTAQAADCDAIARKVADAVGDKLKPIANDAHSAKVAAEAIRTDLDGWREYVKNLLDAGGANHAGNEPTKKKRGKNLATLKPDLGLANVKAAIVKIWDDFNKGEADCEMPNGRLRQFRQSRSFAECIERCGQTVIRGNHTLIDLLTVPESGKKPEVVFEAIVHSADESKRQMAVKIRTKNKHSAKPPQKTKPK